MKKLKIAMCSLLVMFASVLFVACSPDEPKDFNVELIDAAAQTTVTYNGKAQAASVTYDNDDVDVIVTYALASDKDNFKTAEELNLKDVAATPYEVYYKLSAAGYNDYISEETIQLVITPKAVTATIGNAFGFKSENPTTVNVQTDVSGIAAGDHIDFEYSIGQHIESGTQYDPTTAEYGQYYIEATTTNKNYNITYNKGIFTLTEYIQVKNAAGEQTGLYSDLHDAVEAAAAGSTIVLNKTVEVDSCVTIDKTLTIDGQNIRGIKASNNFAGANQMILVNDSNAVLTIRNARLDGNQKTRVIRANYGKLVVEGMTTRITGGKLEGSFIGGVYITNAASFEMTGGMITGNYVSDEYVNDNYFQYTADLWIGANATGSLAAITGGTIGNVFVNANSYSATNPGSFTLDGGTIENIYVEYDDEAGYGGAFKFESGTIGTLHLSTQTSGIAQVITMPETGSYTGGTGVV